MPVLHTANEDRTKLCKLVRVYYSPNKVGYTRAVTHCGLDYAKNVMQLSAWRFMRGSNDMCYAAIFGPVDKRGVRTQLRRWSSKERPRWTHD